MAGNNNNTDAPTSSDGSKSGLDKANTSFAGLSVLIGILALMVGLFQLFRHRRRRVSAILDGDHELEAGLPQVLITPMLHHSVSDLDLGLGTHNPPQIADCHCGFQQPLPTETTQ